MQRIRMTVQADAGAATATVRSRLPAQTGPPRLAPFPVPIPRPIPTRNRTRTRTRIRADTTAVGVGLLLLARLPLVLHPVPSLPPHAP